MDSLWHRSAATGLGYKMKNAKKLFEYASNEHISRNSDIAEAMLHRFANGELSRLKHFLFNTAVDIREISDSKPFDKAAECVSNRELIEASRSLGRICTSFNDTDQSLTLHVFHNQQDSELQNSLLAKNSAALLAVTYAALGVDMRGLIVLSEEDLQSSTKAVEPSGAVSKQAQTDE